MADQYIHQLRNPDPEVRRAAIIALAESPDPRASSYLAQVAKNDPVTSIRVLAERAHRHAQRKEWRAIPTEEHVTPKTDPWYRHIERANAEINDDQRRARSQLHNAHGSNANGDKKGALTYLLNAFELDPALMRSKEAMNLTAELTGEPVETAVDKLMARVKKKAKSEGPTSFGALLGYITIESLALFLIFAGTTYLIVSRLSAVAPENSSTLRYDLARLGGSNLLIACAIAGGILLAAHLIYFLIMFGVALMMGGSGTVFDFLNVMLRVYIVTMIVTVVVIGVAVALKPSRAVISTLSLTVGVANFGAVAYYSAREMDFGFFRGVLTVFAPQILACMIFALLLLLDFGKAAAQFFSSLPS
jgi:hypothetical protein